MKKWLFFIVISIGYYSTIFAQKARIDSILAKLPSISKNDTNNYYFSYQTLIDYYRNVNIDSSDFYIKEFIKIAKRQRWIGTEIYLLTQLGYNSNLRGNYFLSIEHNYRALTLAETNKRNELKPQIELVLGQSYFQLKQFEKASILLNKALKNAQLYKKDYEITACLTAIGNVALEQKNYSIAEKYFRQALARLENDNDAFAKGIAIQNLAVALAKQSKIKDALGYFKQSTIILEKSKQYYQLSNINIDLADLYFSENNYSKSIEVAQQAHVLAQKSKSIDIISKANYWLYKNYHVLNQPEKALQYYEHYILLRDSLNKEDFQKRITSMQFEYESVQKNSKIVEQNNNILQKENENLQLQKNKNYLLTAGILTLLLAGFLFWNRQQLRKNNEHLEQKVVLRTAEITEGNLTLLKKNKEISEALFKGQTIERKRVASELHDNLSSLLSAVKMSVQAIKPSNLSDSEKKILQSVKEMTHMAYNEVRNISHNILPEDLSEKGLIVTLKNLIEHINLAEKLNITLSTNLNEKLDPKIEFNLYSIVLELINNAMKHAQASEASISIEKRLQEIKICVHDNGIGFKQDNISGTGLENIRARISSINGTLSIASQKNIGTKIDISVPS